MLLLCYALACAPAAARVAVDQAPVSVPAGAFDRSDLERPNHAAAMRAANDLAGGPCCNAGWVEYDFDVAHPGWYELGVAGSGGETEYLFNPGSTSRRAWYVYSSSGSVVNGIDGVGHFWLEAGLNTLRIQRYYWNGFPHIRAISLARSGHSAATAARMELAADGRVFRAGECPALRIYTGGRPADTLVLQVADSAGARVSREVAVRAYDGQAGHDGLAMQTVPLPCDHEGDYLATLGSKTEGGFSWRDVRGISYEVIASGEGRAEARTKRTLVQDIDAVRDQPEYSGGGGTRLAQGAAGRYRESGSTGFTKYQRAPDALRRALAEPSWFAYALQGLVPQQPYEVVIDYPDDAVRTMTFAVREDAPAVYPVSTGVNSGAEYALSGGMQSLTLRFWPRGKAARLLVANVHDGTRAALARIRVYKLEGVDAPSLADGGRDFVNWFEEGANFASLAGAPDSARYEFRDEPRRVAVERWMRELRAGGATLAMPTVAVYDFALYPSKYNRTFSNPEMDELRRMLLAAEQSGLKVVPELHPRADDLAFGTPDGQEPVNVLRSREGKSNFFAADGKTRNVPPYFNALLPRNQDWYVGMIGELAERYRDSPALAGISLRVMQWANPALDNLVDLNWGYDDDTIALFKRETGSPVPLGQAGDPGRYAARYAWLMANAREAWVAWRCAKVAALYKRVRDRVRQTRPDLKLYVNVFGSGENLTPSFSKSAKQADTVTSRLRETGIDAALLNAIDGVVLINAYHGHGRREADAIYHGTRDTLLDPAALAALARRGEGGHFMFGATYLEATEVLAPPQALGLPANTRQTWMSAAADAPGRQALERYAVALAQTDAVLLGDGGNGYSFGSAEVGKFMDEFRRLPARAFAPRADAVDPVALRTLESADAYLFYAVNSEPYPVRVDITLSGRGKLARLSGEPLAAEDGPLSSRHLRLDLKPYELVGVRADPASRITAVKTEVPPEQKAVVQRQVEWVERLSQASRLKNLIGRGPDERERVLLADAAATARQALDRGWLWRVGSVLEHSSLLAVYRRLDCYPPQLLAGEEHRSDCAE
jgi:hypothetical protein